ncbi:MAG: VanW family protein [Myxococcota bacterium]
MIRRTETAFTIRRRQQRRSGALLAFAASLTLVGGFVAVSRALTVDMVRVNDVLVPRAGLEDWASAQRARWESEEVTLIFQGKPFRYTRSELGARLPSEELEDAVARVERTEHGDTIPSVYWSPEVDPETLFSAVYALRERTKPETKAEAANAAEGRSLDVHATLKMLKQETFPTSAVVATLPSSKPVLRGSVAGARPGTFSQQLAEHSSNYKKVGRSWSRGHNIERAAESLDGVIIEPHGELSFNEVVGNRSFQRGFMPANEIARGRVVDGIGGGVCQVATALHAAALKAGFDVLEHYVHSKRPRYAGRGFDTAVAWGHKDLRIRNPYPDYVRIRGTARDTKLTIELWSGQRAPDVDISTSTLQGALGAKHSVLRIERVRTVHWPSGPKTDTKTLHYPAEPRD